MSAGTVCNIGPVGVRRRAIGGIVCLALGVAAALLLRWRGASPGWWALLVVPFALAALGWLQAREKT